MWIGDGIESRKQVGLVVARHKSTRSVATWIACWNAPWRPCPVRGVHSCDEWSLVPSGPKSGVMRQLWGFGAYQVHWACLQGSQEVSDKSSLGREACSRFPRNMKTCFVWRHMKLEYVLGQHLRGQLVEGWITFLDQSPVSHQRRYIRELSSIALRLC